MGNIQNTPIVLYLSICYSYQVGIKTDFFVLWCLCSCSASSSHVLFPLRQCDSNYGLYK